MSFSLNLRDYRRIVVLTGAGISVASGLRTYRGADGLWNEMDVESYSTVEGFRDDPLRVWRFYADVRRDVLAAAPNAAHLALAHAEMQLAPGAEMLVVTQNVDSLHRRAGSKKVVDLHGTACRTSCSNPDCDFAPFDDEQEYRDAVPLCPQCGSALRPSVTFFGEALPPFASWQAKRALRDCDLFLAIGTSGTVFPAADFVRGADYAGAVTVYVNPEPLAGPNRFFRHTVLGRAEDVLPKLLTP